MTKFYSLIALAALTAFSADAASRRTDLNPQLLTTPQVAYTKGAYLDPAVQPAKTRALRALPAESYITTYDWTFTSLFKEDGNDPLTEQLTISMVNEATGEVAINGFSGFTVKATLDLSSGILYIPNYQKIGQDSYGPIYFYLKDVNNAGQIVDGLGSAVATVGVISNTTITFPDFDVWAIGDPDAEDDGFFYLTYRNSLTIADYQAPEYTWESAGNASLTDPWLIPAFYDESYTWDVPMQRAVENPNLYRLVNPYRSNTTLNLTNTCTADGYIQFDISDPEHVVFDGVPSDFSSSYLGITRLYCNNTLSSLAADYGYEIEDAIAILGENILYTTFANGVVTLPAVLEPTGRYTNDACFGVTPSDPYAGYCWQDDRGLAVRMYGEIRLPDGSYDSIEAIPAAADNDAAPVYYNLQGLPVDNPASGQILIRRQGAKAEKILFR